MIVIGASLLLRAGIAYLVARGQAATARAAAEAETYSHQEWIIRPGVGGGVLLFAGLLTG